MNVRRVVLVALTWARDKDPRLPLGHASLLAALRAAPDLDVADVCHPVNGVARTPEALAEEIRAFAGAYGDIAIGVYVWNEPLVQRLLPALRRVGAHGRIILGGPQISYAAPGVERLYPDADVFVRGYGEEALVAIARSPRPIAVPGVHWRGETDRGEQARADLSRLASPWLTGAVTVPPGGYVRMETQRGCPFRCSFCQHREPGNRLTKRTLDPGRVRDELTLFARAGVREIAILDPIFNLDGAVETLRTLRALGFRGRISLQCRFELLSQAFLDACEGLDVLLEFGLQTVHPGEWKVIERHNQMPKVEAAMAELGRRGIPYIVSLIFGLPEQTLDSFRASVDFCLGHGVPILRAFPLMLLRGTPLEAERARWGLVESGDAMPMVVASHTFDRDDWEQMARLSDALKATEGRHPASVAELENRAEPQLARWTPTTGGAHEFPLDA